MFLCKLWYTAIHNLNNNKKVYPQEPIKLIEHDSKDIYKVTDVNILYWINAVLFSFLLIKES